MSTPTALIVDDEANVATHLQDKLAGLWPELTVVGIAGNGRQALALVEQHAPDIVFLDIHMPGMTGLEVAERLPPHTRVVFVTAFDQFAVAAFERAAADYLLKPVEEARLRQTVQRLQTPDMPPPEQLLALLKTLTPPKTDYLQWLRAGLDDTTELVSVADVIYFHADQKYTTVATRDREYYVRTPIKALAEQLDPQQFWRIHRATIVRVDQIVSARRDLRGRYTLSLKDTSTQLRSSQSYGHLFKQM